VSDQEQRPPEQREPSRPEQDSPPPPPPPREEPRIPEPDHRLVYEVSKGHTDPPDMRRADPPGELKKS
jgi:hypothetical protein